MQFEEWLGFYDEIVKDFGFQVKGDQQSATLLNKYLEKPDLHRVKSVLEGKKVNIYGAGPSLEKLISFPRGVNIAADGVTSFLLERGVVPDVVVTDLDGVIKDILDADKKGGLIFLHAHGDNMLKVKRQAGRFQNLFGTTQVRPFGNLLNFGGFTDGDRAVFMAEHFKPSRIRLFGMEFDEEPGRYSFTSPGQVHIKKKKLKWAKKLIFYLKEHSGVKIEFSDIDL
jgi:uncharacterized Rossmann fold enzyme